MSDLLIHNDGYCGQCGRFYTTMIFRGTGVCSEDCRKKRDGEA